MDGVTALSPSAKIHLPLSGPMIFRWTCKEFGVSAEEVRETTERGIFLVTRCAAVMLIHEALPRCSRDRIGDVVNRDHISVKNGLRKAQKLCEDEVFRARLDAVRKKIAEYPNKFTLNDE